MREFGGISGIYCTVTQARRHLCQCVEESNNSYLTLFVHVVEQYGCDIEQYLDTMVVYNFSPICRIRLTLILGPGSNSIETPKRIHLISSQC